MEKIEVIFHLASEGVSMAENIRSNSATGNENKGILSGLIDKYSNKTDELDTQIDRLTKVHFEWDKASEDSLFDEIVKLSDENIGNEAMIFSVKKCSTMEEYFNYLREIRDLLAAGYPVEKIFEMIGKIDSKTVFDIVK